jgi:RNA polymerase sigma factor (sigma-70 family)
MIDETRMHEARSLLMPFYPRIREELIRVLGSTDLAEDLTHETFDRAIRFCLRRELPHRPLPWLRAIARNLRRSKMARDRLRERVVSREMLERLSKPSQPALCREAPLGIDPEHLVAALNALSPSTQRLIRGYYFEGKSCGALSDELGIGRRNVKSHLHRARKRIERRIRFLEGGQP